jgi:hypothetical protein
MKKNISNKAFLIGNGINRAISNGVKSWEDLLVKLSGTYNIKVDLDNELKPFPLVFEEIVFKSKGNFEKTLREIKEQIALSYSLTPSNKFHKALINSGIENILTTNYDYAFEKVLFKDFNNQKKYGPRSTDETLNSVKRRTWFKETVLKGRNRQTELSIWHIHGEINQRLTPSESRTVSPANSIMIGYEHYGAYLAEIQKYINGQKSKKDMSLNEKINEQFLKPNSWIDCFFQKELHIAGITLDFSEHHLWWLLNYRAKQIRKGKLKEKNINTIYYYYHVTSDIFPNDPNIYVKSLLRKKNEKAKLDLLEALNVKTIPITIGINDYESYYEQFLKKAIQ